MSWSLLEWLLLPLVLWMILDEPMLMEPPLPLLHSIIFAISGNRLSMPLNLFFLFISGHVPAHAPSKLKGVFSKKTCFFCLGTLWIMQDCFKYINVFHCWKPISVTHFYISVKQKKLNYLLHPRVSFLAFFVYVRVFIPILSNIKIFAIIRLIQMCI